MSTVEDDEQDLTRKQRREQARTQRKELEQAEAASAKRRTRLTQLGIVAGIVVVAIVAILLATGGSSKTGIPKSTKQVNATVSEVNTLLGGIPQNGNTLGNPKAPVTLQYYGDLQCPICKQFTLGALAPLIQSYVRQGKLKIEYHSMETASKEPATFNSQQIAALAAGKQKKAWNYLELFYREQGEEDTGYVTESYLQNLARQVPGLNLANWTAARNDPALAGSITSDAQAVNTNGFTGTPAFLLGKTGGTLQKFEPGTYETPAEYNSAIEKLLKG